jgi:signal transduction histidine kinase
LHQLLLNLVGNALKYHRAEAPPEVEITGCCRAGVVQVMVQDNGIGFEPAQANEIFQPFVRLHADGRYEGAGIGLAICRKIVERHGGSLTAAGCPGQGATFTITLPAGQTDRGGEAR